MEKKKPFLPIRLYWKNKRNENQVTTINTPEDWVNFVVQSEFSEKTLLTTFRGHRNSGRYYWNADNGFPLENYKGHLKIKS